MSIAVELPFLIKINSLRAFRSEISRVQQKGSEVKDGSKGETDSEHELQRRRERDLRHVHGK